MFVLKDEWKIPVLILGTGVTALGVQRVLGKRGLRYFTCSGSDPIVTRSRWYRALPPGWSPPTEAELPSWLESLELDRAVLLPCSDRWAMAVAELPPALRSRFPASVSPPAVLHQLVDKSAFLETLLRMDISHPWSLVVDAGTDFDALDPSCFERAFLKPRDSQRFIAAYGVKALHVSSPEEARSQVARCGETGTGFILQEYVPGPASNHVFVDGFIDAAGECRALFARRRLRMYPVDFGNSSFMRSIALDEVSEAVAAVLQLLGAIGFRGPFSAEFKQDQRDGVFRILEVNARAWWYVEFAALCGVDVCTLSYLDALGAELPTLDRYPVGRRCVYPYYDYFACQELVREGHLTRRSCLRSWLSSCQPVFQWTDPWPAVADTTRVARGRIQATVRRVLRAGP